MTSNIPFGDFSTLNIPEYDLEMIRSGFEAVSQVEGGWEYLRTYTPPEDQGFMFSSSEGKGKEIDDKISELYAGHSGASYGVTMRTLEFIAKKGWDAWVRKIQTKYPKTKETINEKRQRFLALPHDMSLADQMKALEEFKDVPMTYWELRERFG